MPQANIWGKSSLSSHRHSFFPDHPFSKNVRQKIVPQQNRGDADTVSGSLYRKMIWMPILMPSKNQRTFPYTKGMYRATAVEHLPKWRHILLNLCMIDPVLTF